MATVEGIKSVIMYELQSLERVIKLTELDSMKAYYEGRIDSYKGLLELIDNE